MLPQKLTLEGVYSYRKKQTIDFQPLTGGGIFGIFGPVGSGKSAILEAMTYALYGQIERLGQTDQRGYNMMNLQSGRMFIDFEFTHNRSRYRFTVTAKRQKKNFEVISTPERQGYIYSDNQWNPLEDQRIRGGVTAETILGLSYEHFRRTIIIPQGKFQEFIQLTPSHRTGMMESLFNLGRFNLYSKSAALLAAAKSQRAFQEGRMEELGKFRKEELENLENRLRESEKNLIGLTEELERHSGRLRIMDETRNLLEEQNGLLNRQKEMDAKTPEYEKRQKLLKQYKEVHSVFHPLLRQEELLKEERRLKNEQFNQLESRLEEEQKILREGEERWTFLKQEWEKKENLRNVLRSYTASAEIIRLETETAGLDEELEKLMSLIRKHRTEEEELKQKRDTLLDTVQKAEETLPDWDEMRDIEKWFNTLAILERDEASLKQQIADLQEERRGLFRLLSKEGSTEDDADKTEKQFRTVLRKKQEKQEEGRRKFQEERILLETEKKLLDLSGHLENGEPCPVCGSLHHPSPLSSGEFTEKEKSLAERQSSLQEADRNLAEMEKKWSSHISGTERIQVQSDRLKARMDQLQKEKKQALKQFMWKSFAPDGREEFQRVQQEAGIRQNRLREDYKLLQEVDKNLNELRNAAESSLQREQQIKLEKSRCAASIATWQEQLLEEHREDFPPEPQKEAAKLRKHLETLEEEYPRLRKLREELEASLIALEKERAAQQALLNELQQREKVREKAFREALCKADFQTPDQIKTILSRELDIPREEAEIDQFRQQKNIQENQLKDLTAKLADREYDPEKHNALKQRIAGLEEKRGAMQSGAGALQKQIEDMKTGLKEKQKLQKNLRETLNREENLKELTSLLKGNKFTEYIAEIYLQELCQRANERFFPLSGRTLELVFENNSILVRDYLNEGKTRLVKTLSGGQTFQAALSLALALADQIGMGGDHFFFLDEGFGTLDRETLETVMTTLRKVSRDGRIIGLISHVEELRQDLDVWLQIDRTPDEGSRISTSWNGRG